MTKPIIAIVLTLTAAAVPASEYDYLSTRTIHILRKDQGVVLQHSDEARTVFFPVHEVVLHAQKRAKHEVLPEFEADWEIQLIAPGAATTLWLDGAELTDGETSVTLTAEEQTKITAAIEARWEVLGYTDREGLDKRRNAWVTGTVMN